MLPGCAARIEPPAPAVVAVPARELPPAELLACPIAPDPFPSDGHAVIPADVRAPMVALGAAYAGARAQLRRLIRWINPDSPC
jgi:hypothetical protein